MALTQNQRQIKVTTPLEKDALLFYNMHGNEELGRLFKYELDLLGTDANINLDDVLGKQLSVELALAKDKKRYFSGFASSFRYMGMQEDYHLYKATLRPWLWFLTRTADCRIFQNKTVPDIIKEVFRDFGNSEFEDKLSGEYRQWEYCVQYRETAFNFVSRLMEQEGIYYYFKHDQNGHTLVLADSISAHGRISDYEQIPYYPPQQRERREGEYVDDWFVSKGIEPQRYTLSDFDFTKPKSSLEVRESIEDGYADYEIFDYPGEYTELETGQAVARARAEQVETHYERSNAKGNLRALYVGSLFELTNYPRGDQNKEYLLLSARYYLHSDLYRSAKEAPSLPDYRIVFSAMDSIHPFRCSQITPQPTVKGPQTAIVVGPDGEKVWTDQYGRVKVQFHWDRYGQQDENSSCWVRVSQNWAGKNWGGMHIPHIGQEVIVDFLEGDPDRPLITGRVYNADNMPPLELPAHKHKSIIRDDFGNEIVFNANPGDEHIQIFSPHHKSMLEVGKSIGGYSADEHWEYAIGNVAECGMGTKSEAYFGSAYEAFVGNKTEITAGVMCETKIGAQIAVEVGPKIEWSLAPQIHDSDEQIVNNAEEDVIVNGDKGVCISGGWSIPTEGNDKNSIINLDEKHIVLSVGDQKNPNVSHGTPISLAEKKRRERQQIIMTIIAAAGVPAALQGAQIGLNELASYAYDGEDGSISAFTGGIATAQAAISLYQILLAYMIVTSQQKTQKYNKVKHDAPNTSIELKEDGFIEIFAKKGQIFMDADKPRAASPRIMLDGQEGMTGMAKLITEKASLLVQEDGLIEISSTGAGKNIVIDPGNDKVNIAGSTFEKGAGGATIAKNLKVLP
ncbi:MAG: type VI secretion system tip protein TssI/VgrG [Gammaproteobacteria bacterium]|jgi:type VI secretion system secreted protein VgrG